MDNPFSDRQHEEHRFTEIRDGEETPFRSLDLFPC